MNQKLFTICATLVERIAHVDDRFLADNKIPKGGHFFISSPEERKRFDSLLPGVDVACGGSGANTAFAYARLGLPSSFAGTIGNDGDSERFRKDLEDAGVETHYVEYDLRNGIVYILITPDKERSFIVDIAASSCLKPDEVPVELAGSAGMHHLLGYSLRFTPDTVFRCVELAKRSDAMISLDISTPLLVRESMDDLETVLQDTDIVFVNQEEAEAFGFRDERIIDHLQQSYGVETAAYKIGEKGAVMGSGRERVHIPSYPVKVCSTNGAGDWFAAGVLYGIARGHDLEKCGKIGAFCASRCLTVAGSRIYDSIDDIESLI